MVNIPQITPATISVNSPLTVEKLETALAEDPTNLNTNSLTFEALSELAEEYLEIDKEIKRTKDHKSRIWGQDKYLSKPLGNSILEREQLSKETLERINTLQSRREYIEQVLYSNRDNILSGVSLEVLKNKIEGPRSQAHHTGHMQFTKAISNQSANDTSTHDLITFPEVIAMKFQAVYRNATAQISSILDSREAIIEEFKKLFCKGNIPKESRLLVQLLIENKKSYLNTTSSTALIGNNRRSYVNTASSAA